LKVMKVNKCTETRKRENVFHSFRVWRLMPGLRSR
jgi:hypothetical protein